MQHIFDQKKWLSDVSLNMYSVDMQFIMSTLKITMVIYFGNTIEGNDFENINVWCWTGMYKT